VDQGFGGVLGTARGHDRELPKKAGSGGRVIGGGISIGTAFGVGLGNLVSGVDVGAEWTARAPIDAGGKRLE
jgi:hypothetical protein